MPVTALKSTIKRGVERRLDRAAQAFLSDPALETVDFSIPAGEPALNGPDSVAWRIFKNPVTLFVGGVAAVILELAEPRVRSGVWEHSSFRTDPVRRLRRTGLAAMVTVYGARSVAERMIAGVNRRHQAVAGTTADGAPYSASDPELLTWVQATAAFGFLEAYSAYAYEVSSRDRDRYYADGGAAAQLYGATAARNEAELHALFDAMSARLEPSPVLFEFLTIMKNAKAFPGPAQLAQHCLVRAAVDLVPAAIRAQVGLGSAYGLRPLEKVVVRRMARRAERLFLRSGPPAQACRRIGLPEDYLYAKAGRARQSGGEA